MTAVPLSPAEEATLARIEAAPAAEESLRERVARAIWTADEDIGSRFWSWSDATPATQADYRRMADAAIEAMRGVS